MQWAVQAPDVVPGEILHQYFSQLLRRFGPQGWWPARTRLEIIVGAILTQNTTWHNAALALRKLRRAGRLSWKRLRRASRRQLEACVKPAGFYRQKTLAIRNVVTWLARARGGSLNALFALPPAEIRRQLLDLKGLGPETVDAILLYAGRQPFFVADTYTRRVLSRHGLLPVTANYARAQSFLHRHLPAHHAMFSEFHALLVEVGKNYCRRDRAQCKGCPLEEFLPIGRGWRRHASSADVCQLRTRRHQTADACATRPQAQRDSQQKRPLLSPLHVGEGTKVWDRPDL